METESDDCMKLYWRPDRSTRRQGFVARQEPDSPLIVFIHGNSLSGAIFARQFNGEFADRYRIATPDLLGHGRSPRSTQPEVDYTPDGLADAVYRDLDRWGARSVLLVGHSYGAHIALRVAAKLPTAVGLVMVGGTPLRPGTGSFPEAFHEVPGLELAGQEQFSETEIDRWVGVCLQGSPHPIPEFLKSDVRVCDGRHRAALANVIATGDLLDEVEFLRTTKLPIGFIAGEFEGIVRLDRLNALLAQFGRDQVVIVPMAGHAPFWDNPPAFHREIVFTKNKVSS